MVAASCDCPKQQRVNNQHKGVNLDALHGLRIDLLGFILFFFTSKTSVKSLQNS